MSRPRPVWLRSRARCLGHGRALALSCALLRALPPLPCAPCVLLVTTPNLGRDPALEFGSSHSSFCLACFSFFFFSKSSNSLPCYSKRCSSLNTALYPLLKFQEVNYKIFFFFPEYSNNFVKIYLFFPFFQLLENSKKNYLYNFFSFSITPK